MTDARAQTLLVAPLLAVALVVGADLMRRGDFALQAVAGLYLLRVANVSVLYRQPTISLYMAASVMAVGWLGGLFSEGTPSRPVAVLLVYVIPGGVGFLGTLGQLANDLVVTSDPTPGQPAGTTTTPGTPPG